VRRTIEAQNAGAAVLLEKAIEAHRSRKMFLATVSHELRTPLNAILGFSDIIRERGAGSLGNDVYAEYADDIHKSGQHLLSIINEIIEVVSVDSEAIQLNEDVVDVASVIKRCVNMFRVEAARRHLELESVGVEDSLCMRVDEKRLQQVILNLISNAIKFTPDRGRVEVKLEIARNGNVVISVSDTGCGIAPEDIGRVLRPFEQVSNSQSGKPIGTGLGLAITDRLVAAHDGHLAIRSKVGSGTTITATFLGTRVVHGDKEIGLESAA
jgi:two-component system cell cycle sensor histidine kinase PleC